MGKVISLINQKGGVGKTTTSINLSASLALLGKKVLLIDLDPQCNATTGIGLNKGDIEKSIYNVFNGTSTIQDAIVKTKYKNLYVLPANINLAGIDIELEQTETLESVSKSERLKEHINKIKDLYDYIIIDCPPALGIITTNALTASNSVIIPVQVKFNQQPVLQKILHCSIPFFLNIAISNENLNPNLTIEGVLLTMLDARTNLGLEVVEEIRSYFKDKVYNTIIPRLIRLTEAPSHGKPIVAYDPKSRGSEAYLNLAKEVIKGNGTN